MYLNLDNPIELESQLLELAGPYLEGKDANYIKGWVEGIIFTSYVFNKIMKQKAKTLLLNMPLPQGKPN